MVETSSSEPSRKDDFVRSSAYLRLILNHLRVSNDLGQVVILGSGEGGWPKVVASDDHTTGWIHSYLWWKGHERPGLAFHDPRVTVKTEEISSVQPYRCDTLLCNMQPGSVELELRNLDVLESWLVMNQSNLCSESRFSFIIRVMNPNDERVAKKLENLSKGLESGRVITINENDFYFVSGPSGELNYPTELRPRLNGTWPVPDELPDGVKQLAPLDMGATLAGLEGIRPPEDHGDRKFLKELGWFPCSKPNPPDSQYKNIVFEKIMEPIISLIDGYDRWSMTSADFIAINQTIQEKIDHAPVENHQHHEYLWTIYKAIAVYLRNQGCLVRRWSDEGLVKKAKKSYGKPGWRYFYSGSEKMEEYLNEPEVWKPEVKEFRESLLECRPIKGYFIPDGRREPKKENKTRIVWSLGATGRLYDAQVFCSVDELLDKLPYSARHRLSQDDGEHFAIMIDRKNLHAVCDDIKAWDTKVSYSMLCMEAAFLQLLSDDEEHRKEIQHLYRLYAYPVVRIIESYGSAGQEKYRQVFYQLQGQRMSGCRITRSMNTITNIVVTMGRAAWSQGIKVDELDGWVKRCLEGNWRSTNFGGKVSIDRSVIVLGKPEAKKFAEPGAKCMNNLGLIRKKTLHGESQVVGSVLEIEFCGRRFVHVPMYSDKVEKFTRLIPVWRTDEVLMRKLFREDERTHGYDFAWARKQARYLLIDFFHVPTIRFVALAILSATPNNIALAAKRDPGWCLTEEPLITETKLIDEINNRYFGACTSFKLNYRARSLGDLGSINVSDRKRYDLDFESTIYKEWKSDLRRIISSLRMDGYNYDDWIPREDTTESI